MIVAIARALLTYPRNTLCTECVFLVLLTAHSVRETSEIIMKSFKKILIADKDHNHFARPM
jgi:hypothetical protein